MLHETLEPDIFQTTLSFTFSKRVLYLRWNDCHLSAYFGTLMTQL